MSKFSINVSRISITTLAAAFMITGGTALPALAHDGPDHQQGQTAPDGHGMADQGHMMGGQAAGGHMMGGMAGDHHGDMAAIGEPGKASEVTRTITVTMHDISFDPGKISVKAGETIRFKIANKGTLLHEFGLGTAAMHKEHQAEMMKMADMGMIEADRINTERMKMQHGPGQMTMSHDDPNSALVEPGKSAEVIWKFTKPMHLEFACNIPGHYEAGMMGPVDVK